MEQVAVRITCKFIIYIYVFHFLQTGALRPKITTDLHLILFIHKLNIKQEIENYFNNLGNVIILIFVISYIPFCSLKLRRYMQNQRDKVPYSCKRSVLFMLHYLVNVLEYEAIWRMHKKNIYY